MRVLLSKVTVGLLIEGFEVIAIVYTNVPHELSIDTKVLKSEKVSVYAVPNT